MGSGWALAQHSRPQPRNANDNKMKFISMHRLFACAGGRTGVWTGVALHNIVFVYVSGLLWCRSRRQVHKLWTIKMLPGNCLRSGHFFGSTRTASSSKMFAYVTIWAGAGAQAIEVRQLVALPHLSFVFYSYYSVFSFLSILNVHK